jgi:hypothetical protein
MKRIKKIISIMTEKLVFRPRGIALRLKDRKKPNINLIFRSLLSSSSKFLARFKNQIFSRYRNISAYKIMSILIVISSILSINYIWKTGEDIRKHKLYDTKTKALPTDWQIHEGKDGFYRIGVIYDYQVENLTHSGRDIYNQEKFLNFSAALDAMTKIAKKDFEIWYSSRNIHFSKVEKQLKIKNLLYFSLSTFVMLYLFFLRKSIKKFE